MAGALLSYSALTGSMPHREAAAAALGVLAPIAARFPRAAGSGLAVAEALISGPAEIAVIGPADDPRTAGLQVAALQAAPPGAVLARGTGAGNPTAGYPCSPGADWSAGHRPPTSAGGSPAWPR